MTDTSLLPDDYEKFTEYEKSCTRKLLNGETAVAAMSNYENPFGTSFLRWAKAEGYTVIIDRRSAWGNSYKVPPHNVTESIKLYEKQFKENTKLYDRIKELEGKLLLCWCKKRDKYRKGNEFLQACHGDYLAKLANESKGHMES